MYDLEKIFGFKLSNLNKLQNSLLKKYYNSRNQINSKNTVLPQIKNIILKDLNNFYNSLSQTHKDALKDWLTFEICGIDKNIITSLKISEFIIENKLQNNFAISEDGKSYFLTSESYEKAEIICKRFEQKYKNSSYEIIEVNDGK
ncbi:MAG: hypothetical protein ACK4OM_06970 [Alphaproteobacteria bacterium]